MSDRFKGRKKPELPGQDPEWMITLKEWVKWADGHPEQPEHWDLAKSVNNLFSLLGTERAKLRKAEEESAALRERIAELEHREVDLMMRLNDSYELARRLEGAIRKYPCPVYDGECDHCGVWERPDDALVPWPPSDPSKHAEGCEWRELQEALGGEEKA